LLPTFDPCRSAFSVPPSDPAGPNLTRCSLHLPLGLASLLALVACASQGAPPTSSPAAPAASSSEQPRDVDATGHDLVRELASSCSAEVIASCRKLGDLFNVGASGVSRDPDKARRIFSSARQLAERQCDAGDNKACEELALLKQKR